MSLCEATVYPIHKLIFMTQYIYFLVDTTAAMSILSTATSYPNSEITDNNPATHDQNAITSTQAQSIATIQGSADSFPIIIAVVACFAVVVTVAGAVCWFRNRKAKQGKRQQSGRETTFGTRTYETVNGEIATASESTNQQTKQQQQNHHHHQQQQLQPNHQVFVKHTNKRKIHSPNNHHYKNTTNFQDNGHIKDVEIDGYIVPETIPQTSTSSNGYEVPMKNGDNIQELDGYVILQSTKTSSFSNDSNDSHNELKFFTGNLKNINQPQYEIIPGCSH